jgi:hypothetical protein
LLEMVTVSLLVVLGMNGDLQSQMLLYRTYARDHQHQNI